MQGACNTIDKWSTSETSLRNHSLRNQDMACTRKSPLNIQGYGVYPHKKKVLDTEVALVFAILLNRKNLSDLWINIGRMHFQLLYGTGTGLHPWKFLSTLSVSLYLCNLHCLCPYIYR